jgi:hypothetical protein
MPMSDPAQLVGIDRLVTLDGELEHRALDVGRVLWLTAARVAER